MSEPDANLILSITTTVPAREQGLALARQLLAARLAACVQVAEQPITSLYHWQGRLCEEAEWRVTIKTTQACEPALRALAFAHHPYEVPQWLIVTTQASPGYVAWARAEVQP